MGATAEERSSRDPPAAPPVLFAGAGGEKHSWVRAYRLERVTHSEEGLLCDERETAVSFWKERETSERGDIGSGPCRMVQQVAEGAVSEHRRPCVLRMGSGPLGPGWVCSGMCAA